MKNLLVLFSVMLLSIALVAQGFEGTIEFRKVKGGRQSTYIYYVQGDFVRLEEFGPNKTIVDLAVINMKEETVYLLSPERKSYMVLHTNKSTKDMTNTKVEMTKESRTILDHPCKKWVISNSDLNAKVTYWVTPGKYNFFVDLLAALKRKDYHALFYQQVPAAVGYFPMVSTWTDINGVEKERLEVIKINEHILRGNFFTIPSDYTEIKN